MNTSKTVSFYRVVSYLLLLGLVHSALTPVFYDFFTPDGMWFFGTGLGLVFLSFLNIAASRLLNLWLLKFTLFANIVGTIFSILASVVLNEIQGYIGFVFHLIVLFACAVVINKTKSNYEEVNK